MKKYYSDLLYDSILLELKGVKFSKLNLVFYTLNYNNIKESMKEEYIHGMDIMSEIHQ